MYICWQEALNKLKTGVWDKIYYKRGDTYYWCISDGILFRSCFGKLSVAAETTDKSFKPNHVWRDFTCIKGDIG